MNKINLKIDKIEENDITVDGLDNVENGTLEDISVINTFRHIKYEEIPNVLRQIQKKLSPTGKFFIQDIDIRQLSQSCLTSAINEPTLSTMIDKSTSVTSLFSMSNMVKQSGLYTTNKQLNNHEYKISGLKYEPKT